MQRSIQVANFVIRHFCSYGTTQGALKIGGDIKLRQGEHKMAILAPKVGWRWLQRVCAPAPLKIVVNINSLISPFLTVPFLSILFQQFTLPLGCRHSIPYLTRVDTTIIALPPATPPPSLSVGHNQV